MNRRRALQIFAATSFGSVLVGQQTTLAVAERQNIGQPNDLQNRLKEVIEAAASCDRGMTSVLNTHDSRIAIRDAKFFADQAQQRLLIPDGKNPAFWQTCVSRLDAAMDSVQSLNSQELRFQRLHRAISECLPSINQHLTATLG